MTNYYVRPSGSDSNAGTATGTAWRTIGKALGASGATSGDTVYVGPGVYRETITVNAAAAGCAILGDPTGSVTGDAAGPVILSAYPSGPTAAASTSPNIAATSVNGITIQNLHINVGTSYGISLTTCQGWTVRSCVFTGNGTTSSASGGVNNVTAYNAAQNLTVRDCIFGGVRYGVRVWMDRGGSGDYDTNVQVVRCTFKCQFPIAVETSGAGANYGGGVDVANCTCIDPEYWLIKTNASTISTSVPCTVTDCLALYGGIASANTSGQITDGGGNIGSIANANFTATASSRYDTTPIVEVLYSLGHEWIWGLSPNRPLSILRSAAPLGIVGAGSTDLGSVQSVYDGTSQFADSGTATAGTTSTLTDSGKTWGINQWVGWLVRITGGTGSGQVKRIGSNTATALTVSGAAPAGGLWGTTPSTDSTYIVYQGPPVETGKATAGAATSLTDSGANWATNQWAGYTLEILAGTGSGQTKTVASNTSTALTVTAWGTNPDNTSTYALYKTSLAANQAGPGAIAAHNTARPQTSVLNGGSTGYVLDGYASQDFLVPVSAGTTTITVPIRYDSNHGTTNKPQLTLDSDASLGITGSTSTMTAAADTWQSVFVSCTATAAGFARVRVQARSDTPYGRTYIDGGAWRFGRAYGQIARSFQLRPVV